MSNLKKQWSDAAAKVLVGRTIKSVRYMTDAEVSEMMWSSAPLIIEFDDGSWIYPSMDDEGNNAGALFCSDDELQCIPVI